jgi:soluble lytic murein transglycosylase-like protein
MIAPTSPFSFGLPARISQIEARFGSARPRPSPSSAPSTDFDALLAAEANRPDAQPATPAPGEAVIATPPGGPLAPAAPATGQRDGTELRFQPLFEASGERWSVDPALLAAVAEAESGFDPSAVSPAGAQGLMQFMPATAAEMGVDPWDPVSAIDGAARYLRTSLDRFGSTELAVASYNAGRGAVARYGGVPPFPETRNYLRTVLDAWRARS